MNQLLYQLAFQQRSNGSYSDLISLLRKSSAPKVSIINLWSPSCEPCREEFAGFRKLLATHGKYVRFISIQLGKDDARALLAELPPSTFDLHDIGAGNGTIHSTLVDLGLASRSVTIPITMVLDCQHHLRWIQTKQITDMAAFTSTIEQQIEEMPRLCQRQAPASPAAPIEVGASPVSTGPICGDGQCSGGENTETCCKDCGCLNGEYCGQRGVCILDSAGLMTN